MPTAIEQRVISEAGLRAFWPERVRGHAERIAARPPSAGEREDLRELPLVTIDGANARDFDDGVLAEPAGAGWRVIVAIADVSHYVRPADLLDREAARRGVSVYFPGSVLPMLPEVLSNDLCSLKPGVDRLCLACEMHLDARGRLKSWRFFRAVMRSAARLTYSGVHAAIEAGSAKSRRELGALLEPVERLYAVWRLLAMVRRRRGALEVDLPETLVRLGPNGEVRSMEQAERYDAHRVIEELMIAANVATARYLGRARMPALYRVHSPPDADGFEELRHLFAGAGHPLSEAAGRNPDEINRALRALRGQPSYETIAVATLKCMQQACYQPANIGHYGLALKSYTHFTSPIRRYPDLLAHRAIKHLIDGGRGEAAPLRGNELAQTGSACSERERLAEKAMRTAVKAYKLRYLSGCLGDTLDAFVSHAGGKGLFVQVPEVGMKGMIPRWRLPSRRGRRNRDGRGAKGLHGFTLGQQVLVRVARVDEERGHLDLDLLAG
ncbi:MAG: VacB/RNase II family 3'-5' exoribonuclease [Gammaproteobacteria bacterium]|nr:VacB/RNase II family 3'-5' exoribonuclease [Gammaproteobacteria bacterium]